MKKLISASLLSAAMLSPVIAHAEKAELRLIGTITPAACVPNFIGGATIDYGKIPAGALKAAAQNNLPEKMTKLNVTCDSPATFYLKTTDERAATANTALATVAGYGPDSKFGLGFAAGDVKIGAYSLQLQKATPDTGAANMLASNNNGSSWYAVGGGLSGNGGLIGFGNGTSTAPTAHTSVDMDVRVVAVLDKSSALPTENDITIDGLATIEVIYP